MIASSYDPTLVIMSVVIASLASYTAFDLAGRVTVARERHRRAWLAWLACGSIAMGLGIWSMHFVGMLAFRMPMAVAYNVPLVLLSALTAMAASGVALFVASRTRLPPLGLIGAGVIMGMAIAAMHYIGMAAMRLSAALTYASAGVARSVLIAIGASLIALWIAFRFRHDESPLGRWRRGGSAVAMGSAIAGMHYTGMSAAHFVPRVGPAPAYVLTIAHGTPLVGAVIGGSLVVLGLALIGAMMDRRTRRAEAEHARLKAMHDEMEQQVVHRTAELRAARDAAKQANRLKSEFLANMSHELLEPLQAITGVAQLLQQGTVGAVPPEHQPYLGDILTNARHLAQLVNHIVNLSSVDAGRLTFYPEPLDLRQLVGDVVKVVRPITAQKRMQVDVQIDLAVTEITADPARLRQVVYNYLSNALKFTPAGGRIIIRAAPDGADRFSLEVEDSGIGIRPEDLPYPDSGLGLAFTRRLVEAQGGRVGARQAADKGAIFSAVLPRVATIRHHDVSSGR
jgi:NO-binding membrane sensor protein with MHYT domain/nitrogen-specific signal transduction histidine kinase